MSYALCSLNSHCGGALEWDIEPPSCCSSRGSTRLRLCLPECAAGSCYERAQSSLDFSSVIKFKKKKEKKAKWHNHNLRWLSILLFLCDVLTSCHWRLWLLSQPRLTNTHSLQTLVTFSISALKRGCSFSVSWAHPRGPGQGNTADSNLCSHPVKVLVFYVAACPDWVKILFRKSYKRGGREKTGERWSEMVESMIQAAL